MVIVMRGEDNSHRRFVVNGLYDLSRAIVCGASWHYGIGCHDKLHHIIKTKCGASWHYDIGCHDKLHHIINTKCGASWHYDIGCHAYGDVVREIDFPVIVLLPRHRHLAIRGFSGSITPLQVASRLRTECHMAAINVYSRQ